MSLTTNVSKIPILNYLISLYVVYPLIKCDEKQMAQLHEKDVKVICYVYANPMIQTIYWQIQVSEDSSQNVTIDESYKEYRATSEVITGPWGEGVAVKTKNRQDYFLI